MVKGYDIPWCGRGRGRRARDHRARDRRAGRRRAQDRRAAPASEITLSTALIQAPLPTEHLKPWSRTEHHDGPGMSNTLAHQLANAKESLSELGLALQLVTG